jgi:hypothetical protein
VQLAPSARSRSTRPQRSPSLLAALAAVALAAPAWAADAQLAPGLRASARVSKILQKKPKVSPQVAGLFRLRQGRPRFRATPTREFELIPLAQMDFTPSRAEVDRSLAVPQNVKSLSRYYRTVQVDPVVMAQLVCTGVDRRAQQTSIKDQADRGTCVAHAALAALEVAYKPLSLDLSENYGYYKFQGSSEGGVCLDVGVITVNSGQFMTDHGMSEETCWPYVGTVDGIGCPVPIETPWPVAGCASQAKYGVTSHQKILRNDDLAEDVGEWINNPKYLESVLCAGHDIVAGFYVVGWPSGVTGIIDAVQGAAQGGHAMVIVGFVRTADPAHGGGYFILKNSWGTGLGQAGYVYLSYDYMRVYSKYGYYITGVKPLPAFPAPPYNKLILQTRVPTLPPTAPPSKVPTTVQKAPPSVPTRPVPAQ